MNTFFTLHILGKKTEYIGLYNSLASALETGRSLEPLYEVPYIIQISEWLWDGEWTFIDIRIEEEVV